MTYNDTTREDSTGDAEIPKAEDIKNRSGWSAMWSFSLGVQVVIILAGVGAVAYGFTHVEELSRYALAKKIGETLGFSVAKMNDVAIPYAQYAEDIAVLNKFYADQPEGAERPTDEQVSDQVLSRLVANALIGSIAEEFAVAVAVEELAAAKNDILSQFPDEAAATDELLSRYGWTLETYLNKVVAPLLREQKLQAAFEASDNERAKEFQKEEISARHILFFRGRRR